MYQAMVASALESARWRADEIGLPADSIILSCKMSGVQDLVSVYRALARAATTPCSWARPRPAWASKGIVASTAAALALLLQEGIGDTIRVSLTPQPGEARTLEVVVAREILQSLGLRSFNRSVTACPGCGARRAPTFQELVCRSTTSCARRCRSGSALSRRREAECRRDGLHRQRSGEYKARRHRHQPAGHQEAPRRRCSSTARRR